MLFEYKSTLLLFGVYKQHNKLTSTVLNLVNGLVNLKKSSLLPLTSFPSRNTFIVKRVYPVRLHKEENKPRIEKNHYIYDIVENTDLRPDPCIDVVLKSYVKGGSACSLAYPTDGTACGLASSTDDSAYDLVNHSKRLKHCPPLFSVYFLWECLIEPRSHRAEVLIFAFKINEFRDMQLKKNQTGLNVIVETSPRTQPLMETEMLYPDGVGNDGDIVNMKRSDAYSKLLVPGLAMYPTPENLAYSRSMKHDKLVQEKQLSPSVEFLIEYLKKRCVRVIMNKETEWTIEPWHIRSSLRKCGIHLISDDQIKLPTHPIKGPNMDLQDKDFYVTIIINGKHNVKVQCRVHHWATSPQDRIALHPQHWSTTPEFIFPEDNLNSVAEPKSSDSVI